MAEIVKGLFGIDPQNYQEDQLLNQRAQAIQYAKLDPFQKATVGVYQGTQQALGAGANLLGVQDPDLQAQQIASQLATKYDMNDPNSLQQFQQELQQQAQSTGNGRLSEFASLVGNKLMQMKAAGAEIGLKQAQAIKALREPNPGIAALIGKSTPESVARYQQSGNPADLVLAVTPEKLGEGTIKEIATAEKTNTILNSTNTKLDNWLKDVEEGNIQFGLGTRIGAQAERITGKQSANTQKLDSLNKFLENERNNILMAAKGTQTEGDAQRAMNQIMSSTDFNNSASVAQALRDLKAYKDTQIQGNNVYIESMKGTRKLGGGSPSQPKAPVMTTAALYSRVRAQKGWEDATDAEIENAIKSGKIKVGANK